MMQAKVIFGTIICLLACSPRICAQSAVPAAIGRAFDVAVSYSFVDLDFASSNRTSLNGADASLAMEILPRFEVKADLGYSRVTNVATTGFHSDVLTYLTGPVFYPTVHNRYHIYVQGLFGGARVAGAVFPPGEQAERAYVNHLSWAFGGGAEVQIYHRLALRVGADYVNTAFFNNSLAVSRQNDLRTTVGIAYYFQRPPRGSGPPY